MQALILAAGYARRLYPITKDFPKPLLKVRDRPIIDYIVLKLIQLKEIKGIWVITNHKFFPYFLRWRRSRNFRKSIGLIDDLTTAYRSRRGALADIDFAIKQKRIQDNLIIIGGDNLFEQDLRGFVSYIKRKKNHFIIGLYRLKDKTFASHYGVVRVNRQKEVIDFEEKPINPKSDLIGMCLYYFPKDKFFLLEEYLKNNKFSDATGEFISWLYKREKIYTYTFRGLWYDIGEYRALKEAEEKLKIKEEGNL